LRFFWPRLTKLWNCLKRVDADIYYQRTAGMLTGVVAEFARRSSKKSIFAAAGNPDFEPKTSRIRYARDRWLYEYGLRNVDLILAQNRDQQRLCRHHFGRDAIIVQNCFPPASKPPQILKPIVLWVSTVRALKRPEQFLDLAEALPNYCFRMIGGPDSGNEKLFEAIQKRADKIENVEFLGFVPPSKIDSYFDQASILVNTSESEGFPNTFLQAWSRGVPTVSFVDCGARAAGQPVGHQVESFEQMKIIVGEWLSDLTEQIREGQRCRRYFERNHTPSKVLCIYEEIFNELYRENS
jgi:glycosyltransferase involved in cell wall biosynthesis